MVFSTLEAFNDLMRKAHEAGSIEVINQFVSNLDKKGDFKSLKQMAELLDENVKSDMMSLKSPNINGSVNGGAISFGQVYDLEDGLSYTQALNDIVYDPYFSSVLNPNGVVEVADNIYTVGPFGTIVSHDDDLRVVDDFVYKMNTGAIDVTHAVSLVDDNGLYRLNDSDVFMYDTYGQLNSTHQSSIASQVSSGGFETDNRFNNVLSYEFNDAKTWAGNFFQIFFGRSHDNYFKTLSKRRVRVNFYSTNWLVYASTGVNAKIQRQTSGWLNIWARVNNFDEMQIGWRNVSIIMDYPLLNPLTPPKKEFWSGVSRALQSNINFKFGPKAKEYLVYSVQDILDFNKVSNFLDFDLLSKLGSIPLDGSKALESALDKQAIDRLVKLLEGKVANKTKEIAFTTVKAGTPINRIYIPSGISTKNGNSRKAELSEVFDWETAIFGIKTSSSESSFTFKPAKTLKVSSGQVYGLGKLNGEWAGVNIIKK